MLTSSHSAILWQQFTKEVLASIGADTNNRLAQVMTSGIALPMASQTALKSQIDLFLSIIPAWGSVYVASLALSLIHI